MKRTFSSMGYVLVGSTWMKKESVKTRITTAKPSRISADSAAILLKDFDEIKARLTSLEDSLEKLISTTNRLVRLNKETNIDVGKLHLALTSLKKNGISTVNQLMKQVDSMKSGVISSETKLVLNFQTSYFTFSRNIEWS